jgi:hypothetical protein
MTTTPERWCAFLALIERVVIYDTEEMARRGRLGAAALHARRDPKQLAANASSAFLDGFKDREALRAHMRRLARASAAARRARSAVRP